MTTTPFTLVILALIAVLGVLIIGVIGMAKGGTFNRRYGNRLMQARVFLQAAALIIFAFAIAFFKK